MKGEIAQMKTAIVTGAGGFIGGALTRKLLDSGVKVYGVDINKEALARFDGNSNFIGICSGLDSEGLTLNIREKCDVLFHFAWGGGVKDYLVKLTNSTELQIESIISTVKMFESLKEMCTKFIFCSSSYEFMRDLQGMNVPMNIYGIAKKAAADICASIAYKNNIGFNKVIFTNTFGVGDISNKAVNTIIRKMLSKEPLKLVEGNNKNDWVYIDDTVNGLIAAAERGVDFKEYYIGHRDISTFKDSITAMRDVLAPETELVFGTMREDTYIDYSMTDLDALYNDTGFECNADFKESIVKTAEYIEKEHSKKNIGGG